MGHNVELCMILGYKKALFQRFTPRKGVEIIYFFYGAGGKYTENVVPVSLVSILILALCRWAIW